MENLKLYMLLIGCTPAGRNTEQHDVFFSIAKNVKELVPAIIDFWPEANGKLHLDAMREVLQVGEYDIGVQIKETAIKPAISEAKLFFINLGGYKRDEFEEFHYKMIVACKDKGEAITESKQTAFYKHVGFAGAPSHVDDKFGVDVDDLYQIEDILPPGIKEKYSIVLTKRTEIKNDAVKLGYMMLEKL
ncbi:MAG: DUF1543 domain-containing protein [Ferruginibacter sp.]